MVLFMVRVIIMKRKLCIPILFALILSAVTADLLAADPQVTLQITGSVSGSIVLELYPDKAPVTVNNFIDYVRSGFYDGLIFHRVVKYNPPNSYISVIQGGGYDPNMVKKTPGQPIINESSNGLSNLLGTIAMARTPDPHSATSEFFINQLDNLPLDYGAIAYDSDDNAYYKVGYCVFGRVISGMSIVNDIAALPTITKGGHENVPADDVIIQSATVTLEAAFCTEKLQGDIDGDCDVDTVDLLKFAIQWLDPKCRGCYSADISDDGEVNFIDFAKMAANWLNCNSITTPCDQFQPSTD